MAPRESQRGSLSRCGVVMTRTEGLSSRYPGIGADIGSREVNLPVVKDSVNGSTRAIGNDMYVTTVS